MRILVLNSGSSSIKFAVFGAQEPNDPRPVLEGEASGLGTGQASIQARDTATGTDATGGVSLSPGADADAAIAAMVSLLRAHRGVDGPGDLGVDAVGYRVVHPGPHLRAHCRLTPEVLTEIKAATAFAPLHQPPMLRLVEQLGASLADVPAFACFDTVFHETMPEEARTYALPAGARAQGVRRYGFHGLSCEGVVSRLRARAAERSADPFPQRLLVAHLGSGCSVTAIHNGKSVENTMGLTPDGGVVMGTRPGDLDPGAVLFLLREAMAQADPHTAVDRVEALLNRESGTAALAGMENDMHAIRKAAESGNNQAALAIRVFTRSVQKAIGSYLALLGGLDALVFTGGIGEHDSLTRSEVLQGLDLFGLKIDIRKNNAQPETTDILQVISPGASPTGVFIVRSEEESTIARHVAHLM